MQILLPTLFIIFDFAIPVALLLWLWKSTTKSRLHYLSVAILAVTYLVAIKLTVLGFWHVIGEFWSYLYLLVAVAAACFRLVARPFSRWLTQPRELIGAGFNAALAALCLLGIASALNARYVHETPVNLSLPLSDGKFVLISGGGNLSVNQHSRGVRYAMDITQLNKWGRRSSSLALFPNDLEKYEIFGAEIVAPCAGEVIGAEDSAPEQAPLHPSFEGIGNYVALYCQGHTIRLLHMKQGSAKVSIGDLVAAGQPIGNVGNSGNTVEPHLHIDAVAGRQLLDPRNDRGVKSVPITIDGRFLVKGDSM